MGRLRLLELGEVLLQLVSALLVERDLVAQPVKLALELEVAGPAACRAGRPARAGRSRSPRSGPGPGRRRSPGRARHRGRTAGSRARRRTLGRANEWPCATHSTFQMSPSRRPAWSNASRVSSSASASSPSIREPSCRCRRACGRFRNCFSIRQAAPPISKSSAHLRRGPMAARLKALHHLGARAVALEQRRDAAPRAGSTCPSRSARRSGSGRPPAPGSGPAGRTCGTGRARARSSFMTRASGARGTGASARLPRPRAADWPDRRPAPSAGRRRRARSRPWRSHRDRPARAPDRAAASSSRRWQRAARSERSMRCANNARSASDRVPSTTRSTSSRRGIGLQRADALIQHGDVLRARAASRAAAPSGSAPVASGCTAGGAPGPRDLDQQHGAVLLVEVVGLGRAGIPAARPDLALAVPVAEREIVEARLLRPRRVDVVALAAVGRAETA